MIRKISLLLLIALSLSSCVSSRKINYFQNYSERPNKDISAADVNNFNTRIKPDDLLLIIVSAPDPLAAEPFNLPFAAPMNSVIGTVDLANVQNRYQNYLVDRNGEINFPVLGKLKLGGLTKDEVLDMLYTELKKYIDKPIVNLRILNYKIAVLGEVARPGSYSLISERISIPEALSLAGDLTIYGNRQEVLIIRDINGLKTHFLIDLTSPDIIDSPLFYLQQNDVIYVKPNKVKANAAGVGPNTTVIISALSLLLTTIALLTR